MNTLPSEVRPPRAIGVKVTKDALAVDLEDGRSVIVPLGWYPRLSHGTAQERGHWRLISHGEGIHWPDLDEDISITGLLAGHASGESQESFQRWLAARKQGRSNKRLNPAARARRAQTNKRLKSARSAG